MDVLARFTTCCSRPPSEHRVHNQHQQAIPKEHIPLHVSTTFFCVFFGLLSRFHVSQLLPFARALSLSLWLSPFSKLLYCERWVSSHSARSVGFTIICLSSCSCKRDLYIYIYNRPVPSLLFSSVAPPACMLTLLTLPLVLS